MPVLLNNEEVMLIPGSSFQFSAIKPDELESTEYTLVTIVVDESGSVAGFSNDLLNMLNKIIEACKKNPRSENLMVRVVSFNDNLREIHGFKPLEDIDPSSYSLMCGGMTALYDATFSAVGATVAYSNKLMNNDFDVNGIVFIITDGCDNVSSSGPNMIKEEVEKSKRGEVIESLITVLIGINTTDAQVVGMLDVFKNEADLTQFVNVGEATPSKLAKLGGFISKSISSTSQTLGSGKVSQQSTLVF